MEERAKISQVVYRSICIGGCIYSPFRVGQSIGGRGRLGRCMFVGKFGGRLLEGKALGKVSHVGDAHVENGLQFLGKCRIELHPRDKGCKKPRKRESERVRGGIASIASMLMLSELIDVLA